ncbi:MAG: HAMP domain-containing histidine kinase [Thermomicrobiales bacterium]|nr:HAMP domain-containing histidine kinase [Thermomicrobiales bacterium]
MTLRSGLVLASALVIALSIAFLSAFAVRTTRATLTDQIDQQIITAADKKTRNPPREGYGQPSGADTQSGTAAGYGNPELHQNATLVFNASGDLVSATPSGYTDDPDPLPDLTSVAPGSPERAERFDQVTTIGAVEGDMRFRIYVCDGRNGEVIATAAPLTEVDDAVSRILRFTLGAGVVALVLAGAASWFLIRNRLQPVDRMIDTAAAIAAGDLSRRAPDANPRTELGRLSHALNDMLGQIEESVEARVRNEQRLRRFVADAAHELRTPLTSLRGFAELHRAGALNDPDQLNNAMRRIETESGRMQRLVDDLLMLARLDEQRGVVRSPVDLTPLLEDSIAAALAIEPDRPISADLAPNLLTLGDAGHFRQIFDNLITNARIHTPAGTAISVSARAEEREVVVTIADRGPGIPKADQERIFERFWRADPSRTRATGGSGLGLAIVASLVRAHDGTITLESTPGAGAAFTIRFPRSQGSGVRSQE